MMFLKVNKFFTSFTLSISSEGMPTTHKRAIDDSLFKWRDNNTLGLLELSIEGFQLSSLKSIKHVCTFNSWHRVTVRINFGSCERNFQFYIEMHRIRLKTT